MGSSPKDRLDLLEKIVNDMLLIQLGGVDRRIAHLESENKKQWALFKNQSNLMESMRREIKELKEKTRLGAVGE